MQRRDITPYLVFSVPLIFLVIFLFWPLVTTILRAFSGSGFNLAAISELDLSNFQRFFTSSLYQRSMRNSFVVAFSVVFFTLLIGVPMGYFVARTEMPFKGLIPVSYTHLDVYKRQGMRICP